MDGEAPMNEEMAGKLVEAKSAEDVQTIANSYGHELTIKRAQEVFEKIKSLSTDGELSDDMLEAVTGGGTPKWWTDQFESIFY